MQVTKYRYHKAFLFFHFNAFDGNFVASIVDRSNVSFDNYGKENSLYVHVCAWCGYCGRGTLNAVEGIAIKKVEGVGAAS